MTRVIEVDVAEAVRRSRAAQKMPPHVEDPRTLRDLAHGFISGHFPPLPPSADAVLRAEAAHQRRFLRAEAIRRARLRQEQLAEREIARRYAADIAQLSPEQVADVFLTAAHVKSRCEDGAA